MGNKLDIKKEYLEADTLEDIHNLLNYYGIDNSIELSVPETITIPSYSYEKQIIHIQRFSNQFYLFKNDEDLKCFFDFLQICLMPAEHCSDDYTFGLILFNRSDDKKSSFKSGSLSLRSYINRRGKFFADGVINSLHLFL